jgi:hypothetical protein
MKSFYPAWLVIFVAWMLGDMVIHGMLLGAEYAKLTALYRAQAESQALFGLMLLAHAMMAWALVWIYRQGLRSGPWLGQGLRFGLAAALLAPVPNYLIYYIVQPTPLDLMLRQVGFSTVLLVLLGGLVAFCHRNTSWTHSKF